MRFPGVKFSRSPWPELAVFVASVLVIVVFWRILPASLQINENSDYKSFYEPVARRVLQGTGLTHADGTPATRYPPGYPILLAGAFKVAALSGLSEERALAAFTLVCMGIASVLLFKTATLIWGLIPALLSSVLWMTYPFALWLTKQPNSEVPFLVFFYAAICLFSYAMTQKKTTVLFLLVGVVVGLSSLIRPAAIAMTVVLSGVVWLLRSEVKAGPRMLFIFAMMLGNLAAIAPWEVWVYSKTQQVVPLSSAGTLGILDGLTFAVVKKDYRQAIKVQPDVSALMEDIHRLRSESTSTGSLTGVVTVMIDKLRRQPLSVLKLYFLKASRAWYGSDSGRFEMPIMAIQAAYLVLIVWGGIGAWRSGGNARELAISVMAIIVYFWMMTIIVLSILRYMIPAIGLSMILVPGLRPKWARSPNHGR
jgi:4-amino-4-deoxy-L-arabinose transferase-like glycosyltransferase